MISKLLLKKKKRNWHEKQDHGMLGLLVFEWVFIILKCSAKPKYCVGLTVQRPNRGETYSKQMIYTE